MTKTIDRGAGKEPGRPRGARISVFGAWKYEFTLRANAKKLRIALAIAIFVAGCSGISRGQTEDALATTRTQPPIFAGDQRPNIVFFLVDDLGWQDSSVAFWSQPTELQSHFRTPHVELLARQGVRFCRAYSCPVCSPTRVSIVTGMNAARHRVTNWILYRDRETSGQTARLSAPRDWARGGVDADANTLPRLLSRSGYTTIHCGKAHWGAVGLPAERSVEARL